MDPNEIKRQRLQRADVQQKLDVYRKWVASLNEVMKTYKANTGGATPYQIKARVLYSKLNKARLAMHVPFETFFINTYSPSKIAEIMTHLRGVATSDGQPRKKVTTDSVIAYLGLGKHNVRFRDGSVHKVYDHYPEEGGPVRYDMYKNLTNVGRFKSRVYHRNFGTGSARRQEGDLAYRPGFRSVMHRNKKRDYHAIRRKFKGKSPSKARMNRRYGGIYGSRARYNR